MPQRIRPEIVVDIDWYGNDTFDHPLHNVSDEVISYNITYGTSLGPYSPNIEFVPARGQLVLDNTDHKYDLIGGQIESTNMIKSRACKINMTGIGAIWEGRVLLDAEALAENNDRAVFRVLPHNYNRFAKDFIIVNNSIRVPMKQVIQDEVFRTVYDRDITPAENRLFSLTGLREDVKIGPLLYEGLWPQLLTIFQDMAGGWFYEDFDGVIRFISLEAAIKKDPEGVFTSEDFEEIEARRGGVIPGTVFNTANFVSRNFVPNDFGDNGQIIEREIDRKRYTFVEGQPIEVSYSFVPTERQRLVTWSLEPYDFGGPVLFNTTPTITDTSISVNVTPQFSGARTVIFYGFSYRSDNFYSEIDRPIHDPAFIESVESYGLRDLRLPPWQTTDITQSTINLQRRFLRMLYEPLKLVVHSWDIEQTTTAKIEQVRRHTRAGTVISVDGKKILTLSTKITGNIDSFNIESRGIDLDDITIPNDDDLPPFGLPIDPVQPEIDTDTGDEDVDSVFREPPGKAACSLTGDELEITWSDTSEGPTIRHAWWFEGAFHFDQSYVPLNLESFTISGGNAWQVDMSDRSILNSLRSSYSDPYVFISNKSGSGKTFEILVEHDGSLNENSTIDFRFDSGTYRATIDSFSNYPPQNKSIHGHTLIVSYITGSVSNDWPGESTDRFQGTRFSTTGMAADIKWWDGTDFTAVEPPIFCTSIITSSRPGSTTFYWRLVGLDPENSSCFSGSGHFDTWLRDPSYNRFGTVANRSTSSVINLLTNFNFIIYSTEDGLNILTSNEDNTRIEFVIGGSFGLERSYPGTVRLVDAITRDYVSWDTDSAYDGVILNDSRIYGFRRIISNNGSGAQTSLSTTLKIARGSIPFSGSGIPANTHIIIETNQLNATSVQALANTNALIRGQRISFGTYLGTDTVNGVDRYFFAEGQNGIPDDLVCQDFDLEHESNVAVPKVIISLDDAGLRPVTTVTRDYEQDISVYALITDATQYRYTLYGERLFGGTFDTEQSDWADIPDDPPLITISDRYNSIVVEARNSVGKIDSERLTILVGTEFDQSRFAAKRVLASPLFDQNTLTSYSYIWNPGYVSIGSTTQGTLEAEYYNGVDWVSPSSIELNNEDSIDNTDSREFVGVVHENIASTDTKVRLRQTVLGYQDDWIELNIPSIITSFNSNTTTNVYSHTNEPYNSSNELLPVPTSLPASLPGFPTRFEFSWVDTEHTLKDDVYYIIEYKYSSPTPARTIYKIFTSDMFKTIAKSRIGDQPRLFPFKNFIPYHIFGFGTNAIGIERNVEILPRIIVTASSIDRLRVSGYKGIQINSALQSVVFSDTQLMGGLLERDTLWVPSDYYNTLAIVTSINNFTNFNTIITSEGFNRINFNDDLTENYGLVLATTSTMNNHATATSRNFTLGIIDSILIGLSPNNTITLMQTGDFSIGTLQTLGVNIYTAPIG